MPEPANYRLNIPNPSQAVLQGVQLAQGIGQARGVQADARAREAEAAGLEAKNQRTQQFQAAVAKIAGAPSAAGYASLVGQFPELSGVLKESYDILSKDEQTERIRQASTVYSALSAGENEFAQETLTKQAEAYRAAGREQDAKQLDDLAKLVELSPETAQTTAGLFLATNMGAEKFVEGFSKLEGERRNTAKEGAELTEAEAKAESAAVKAKFAESDAVLELQKKGYDIEKIKNDIQVSRENTRIAAMNAALAKETNQQRAELLKSRITDAQLKRDEVVRNRIADAESARGNIDNLINTVDRALKIPLGVLDDITGTVDSKTFTFGEAEADAEELIETLKSQSFLAQVPQLKGLGALSNAEGEKLQSALQNISLRQGPARLTNNLREIQRLILKARANIATRYGVPETIPDTPAAAPDDPELNAILDQFGAGTLSGGVPSLYGATATPPEE